MTNVNNMPKLRFDGFSGDWEVSTLGKIAKKITLKNKDDDISLVFTNSATQGIVNQRDYFNKDIANQKNLEGYFIVEKNDFIYNPRCSVSAPVGPISKNKIGQGVMSPLYTVFRFNDEHDGFYEHYFQTSHWHIYLKSISNTGARHDRMSISAKDFMQMPLPFPALPEQQKIAECLSSLDEIITAETEQATALEQHKKALMQQLFPQNGELVPKLRFEGFSGDWEEKALGNLGSFKNGVNKGKEDFGFGYPFINLQDVFGNTSIKKSEYSLVNVSDQELNAYSLFKGDVLFIRSSVKREGIGETSVILEDLPNTVYSGFIIRYRDNDFFNTNFKKYCFWTEQFRSEIISNSTTNANTNINQSALNHINIKFPNFAEQEKIAECLSSLDELITAQHHKINALKQHKKGMMQGLFPSA